MIKKLILLVLAVGAIYGAMLSPFSYNANKDIPDAIKEATEERTEAEVAAVKARDAMRNAKSTFDDNHDFDVAYNDIEKLNKLLTVIAGISVSEMYSYDPISEMQIGPLDPENITELPPAVEIHFVVSDLAKGLAMVNQFQLPIINLTASEPGNIVVIFLTGGDLNA